jgi:uncharacterized YigZ family protein
MILYKTAAKQARAEQIIKKSRFIATVMPVSSKEEADAFIAAVTEEFKDATHNVPAMVVGDKSQIQWASDNGEPQGTSGAPMVKMLVSEGLTNVAIVVTRYFGGIKLGTGGLVRAYTGTAKLALEEAGVKEVKEMLELIADLDYTYLPRLQKIAGDMEFEITNIDYSDTVTVTIVTAVEHGESVKSMLADMTSGRVKIISEVRKTS